jgi:hypothetical protein
MLVVAFGVFLTGLAVLIAIKPLLAERFLRSFASSTRASMQHPVSMIDDW